MYQQDLFVDIFSTGVFIALFYVAYYYLTPKTVKKDVRKKINQFLRWLIGKDKGEKTPRDLQRERRIADQELKDANYALETERIKNETKTARKQLENLKDFSEQKKPVFKFKKKN